MKISITGADGFIGRWVIDQLQSEGYRIRCLDRTKEDLLRSETLKQFVSDSSVIIHLAGKNRASNAELYESNTVGTLGLMRACERYAPKNCRIIFGSSLQVYQATSESIGLAEDHPVTNETAFSNSKLLAEEIIRNSTNYYDIDAVVMRIANAYGFGCKPYYNSVIATFLDLASHGKSLKISDGSQTRDFIYAGDVAKAVSKLSFCQMSGFEILNISTGTPTSILDLAEKVRSLFPGISIVKTENEGEEIKNLIGDPSKANTITGFRANTTLDEGLRLTLR